MECGDLYFGENQEFLLQKGIRDDNITKTCKKIVKNWSHQIISCISFKKATVNVEFM